MKDKIRPIYSEIQGYLSAHNDKGGTIFSNVLWEQYNNAVEELNKITGEDYNKFLLKPNIEDWNGTHKLCIRDAVYHSTISGLINRLYGKYFFDERHPFSGNPSTIINQSQQQNQSVQIEILLDIQSKIDEKMSRYEEGSKEKNFLQKVKAGLSSAKNIVQLIALLLKTGKDIGLTVEQILNIFQ